MKTTSRVNLSLRICCLLSMIATTPALFIAPTRTMGATSQWTTIKTAHHSGTVHDCHVGGSHRWCYSDGSLTVRAWRRGTTLYLYPCVTHQVEAYGGSSWSTFAYGKFCDEVAIRQGNIRSLQIFDTPCLSPGWALRHCDDKDKRFGSFWDPGRNAETLWADYADVRDGIGPLPSSTLHIWFRIWINPVGSDGDIAYADDDSATRL